MVGSPHLFGRISLKGYLRGELVHRSCLKAGREQRLSGLTHFKHFIQNKGERERERERDKQYKSQLRLILFTLLLSPFLPDVSSENNAGERERSAEQQQPSEQAFTRIQQDFLQASAADRKGRARRGR